MERRKRAETIKVIQQHEASTPRSVRKEIQAVQAGEAIESLFAADDPKKRELYALLGMVIGEVWSEIRTHLQDPASEEGRFLFEESTRCAVRVPRHEIEEKVRQEPYMLGACKILFSQYRALFHEGLEAWVARAEQGQGSVQSLRVRRRLQSLIDERAHSVQSASTLVEEVMAGLGTSGQVMTFIVSSIPDVFSAQYKRAPTPDEWLMIARNSEKFILSSASKNLDKFIQMGHIFRRSSYSRKTSNGGIWNEQLFCIDGEGDDRSLGVQGGPLASLLAVRDVHEVGAEQTERVGCPALYVDAIGPLYQAFLRDVEVYLGPKYGRLTTKGSSY